MNGIRGLLLSASLALLLGSVAISRLAHAAGVPESVVIVVNADSWISRAVAHEYRALRGIPPTNLIEVGGLSNFEQIGVDEFRDRILRPVLAAIANRQLSPQIDYVVYSADLPTAIDIRGDLGQRPLPRVFTPTASINGLTYLHQAVLDKDPRYVDFQANHYARRVRAVSFDSPWTPAEVELYAKTMSRWESHQREIAQAGQPKAEQPKAEQPKPEQPKPEQPKPEQPKAEQAKTEQPKPEQPNSKQPKSEPTTTAADDAADTARATRALLETTLETLRGIEKAHPRSPELLYNIACSLALLGQSDDAMKALDGAVAAGWLNHQQIERDRDFESLRGRPDYKTLLEKLRDTPIDVQPTIGFQARKAWTAAGEPLAIDPLGPGGQGEPANTPNSATPANLGAALAALQTPPRRYLLSTVLAVTRGRGLSVDESLANLRRSVSADGSRPTGTIYIERNGDVRSTTREWAFRGVVRRLEMLGVRAVVESGVLPKNRTDVAGAVIGIADFQWPTSGSEILPGAIVEHLTSFGGVMTKGAGQTPLIEFLRHGAAGASGTVTEPFAIQAKFPTPFIHVYYAEGCTLAESFYQAVSGPYQLLIVGDALCRPWARPLTLTVDGQPIDGARLTNKLELAPRCESTAGIELAECRLYVDGRLIRTTGAGTPLTLDPALMDGGPHEATIVAIGNDAVRTVARRSFRFETGDPARNCQARLANDQPLAWEQSGRMAVSAIGAQSIEVLWGTRSLGRIEGPSGEVTLDPRSVGPGLMRLQALARYADNTAVRSPVVELRVLPPPNDEPPVPRK
ncbi:MAG: TPR end-of-group domain-containing protein [Planctomycetota bacterium]